MRLEFTIGDVESIAVTLERSAITGRMVCRAEGVEQLINDPIDLGTHFMFRLSNTYHVAIEGKSRSYLLEIQHTRPKVFAGFRPQDFKVLLDGKEVARYRGY